LKNCIAHGFIWVAGGIGGECGSVNVFWARVCVLAIFVGQEAKPATDFKLGVNSDGCRLTQAAFRLISFTKSSDPDLFLHRKTSHRNTHPHPVTALTRYQACA